MSEQEAVDFEKEEKSVMENMRHQIECFKSKMEDFKKFVDQMEEEKKQRLRRNNEKIQQFASIISERMNELHEEILVLTNRAEDENASDKLQKKLNNAALDIIDDIKIVYNEGAGVLND